MHRNGRGRETWGEWLFVCALFALCAVLGILQYRAIAEVSIAARERLRGSLEASLFAFSQDFNSIVSSAAGALLPAAPEDAKAARNAVTALYARGGPNARYRRLFAHRAGRAGETLTRSAGVRSRDRRLASRPMARRMGFDAHPLRLHHRAPRRRKTPRAGRAPRAGGIARAQSDSGIRGPDLRPARDRP